jgi:hypothetical protein
MLEPSERISFAPERILRSVMLRPERWFRPVIPRLVGDISDDGLRYKYLSW